MGRRGIGGTSSAEPAHHAVVTDFVDTGHTYAPTAAACCCAYKYRYISVLCSDVVSYVLKVEVLLHHLLQRQCCCHRCCCCF